MKELIEKAKKAMDNAYCPYSGYKVGAALKAKSGKIYTGCNIESVSFTPTCCAERTAFFKAVSEGEREFEMIAVCGGKNGVIEGYFPPCGVCRQVMREFCDISFPVILIGKDEYKVKTVDELLPESFFEEGKE